MSKVNEMLAMFLGGENKEERVFDIVKTANVPTQQQINTYYRLCKDKGVKPSNIEGITSNSLSAEINRLLQLKRVQPISEGQRSTILDICTRNNWDIPEMDDLTGGRTGSASKLIQELLDLERNFNSTRPLSDNQKQMILDMYYCPDVLFDDLHEDFGTKKMITADKVYWTRISLEKMANEIENKVTQSEARDFLNRYKGVFYDWKITRLTEPQMRRIQNLQERNYMKPMTDTQLLQFSKKDAERYIRTLESVLRDKEITKFSYEPVRETKLEELDSNRLRTANRNEPKIAYEKYENRLESLIYSLYASLGMNGRDEDAESMKLEDIRDLIGVAIDENGSESIMELVNEIMDGELDELSVDSAENTEDEYVKAEQVCEAILASAMQTPLEAKKHLRQSEMTVQRLYDYALINDELYMNMIKVFKKLK